VNVCHGGAGAADVQSLGKRRWSFGILMYELVYGFTPFRGTKRDQTFENILKRPLLFPPKPEISEPCQVCSLPNPALESRGVSAWCKGGRVTCLPGACALGTVS